MQLRGRGIFKISCKLSLGITEGNHKHLRQNRLSENRNLPYVTQGSQTAIILWE